MSAGLRPRSVAFGAAALTVLGAFVAPATHAAAATPLDSRPSSLVVLGDSEMSGEGEGDYTPDTDGAEGNWCHRSYDDFIFRTGIPSDQQFNFACSGASTADVQIGGENQYSTQPEQTSSLATAAKNTHVKLIVLGIGANDDIQFGPTVTTCVENWFLSKGPCNGTYNAVWPARVSAIVPKVEKSIRDVQTTMANAGYLNTDYKLVVMAYPSPMGPDYPDNPSFSTKIAGGCTGYDADMAWGRNTAVPEFEAAEQQAAVDTGAIFLNNSRLFGGHEVCSGSDWARGLWVDLIDGGLSSNAVRQSFHPNYFGHGAFASCVTQVYNSAWTSATCTDDLLTGNPTLHQGVIKPTPIGAPAGRCVDDSGSVTLDKTPVLSWACTGSANQGWWFDPDKGQIHAGLTQARCMDVAGAAYTNETPVILYACGSQANQQWSRGSDGTIRPKAAQGYCLTAPGTDQQLVISSCDGSANQRFTW